MSVAIAFARMGVPFCASRPDREPVSVETLEALSSRLALTAYDGAYLELALRRGIPLLTRDVALIKAMSVAGVAVADC